MNIDDHTIKANINNNFNSSEEEKDLLATNFIKVIKDKNNPYFMMNNKSLRDPNLSLKAKGLLAYMFTHSDQYKISIAGLAVCLKEGKDAIRSTINELIENHYVLRFQTKNKKNKYSQTKYYIFNVAQKSPNQPPDKEPPDKKDADASVV